MIHEATRTLVKSQPEVWEQCSDPESLSRHLNGSFGEIRITRLEPESTVAWEGEHGSGTVTIEPSAWGTRVTLTAQTELKEPEPDPATPDVGRQPAEEPEPMSLEPASAEPAPQAEPSPELPSESESVPDPEPILDAEPARDVVREVEPAPDAPPKLEPAPDAPPKVEPAPERSRERLSRLLMRVWRGRAVPDAGAAAVEPSMQPPEPAEADTERAREPVASEPEPSPPVQPEPLSPPGEHADGREDGEGILMAALESMGQAHHRPYSRG